MKLISFQVVKILPSIYGTWLFITAFPWARQLFLSWFSSIQSIRHISLPEDPSSYYYPISSLVSQMVYFLQASPQNTVYSSPLSYTITYQTHLNILDLIIRKIMSGECRSLSITLFIFSTTFYLISTGSNYSSEHLNFFSFPQALIPTARIWWVPGDICVYSLSIVVSASKTLGSGISFYADIIRHYITILLRLSV